MKSEKGVDILFHPFLISALDGEVVNFLLWPLYSGESVTSVDVMDKRKPLASTGSRTVTHIPTDYCRFCLYVRRGCN